MNTNILQFMDLNYVLCNQREILISDAVQKNYWEKSLYQYHYR